MMRGTALWGDKMLKGVEEETERLVNNSYMIAKAILLENRELFEHLTQALMETEVVSAEEFQMMLVKFNARLLITNLSERNETERVYLLRLFQLLYEKKDESNSLKLASFMLPKVYLQA